MAAGGFIGWTPIPATGVDTNLLKLMSRDPSGSFGNLLGELGNITDKYVDRGKDVLANAETRQKLFDQQYKDQVAIRTGAWINQHQPEMQSLMALAQSGNVGDLTKAQKSIYEMGLPPEVAGNLDKIVRDAYDTGLKALNDQSTRNQKDAAAQQALAHARLTREQARLYGPEALARINFSNANAENIRDSNTRAQELHELNIPKTKAENERAIVAAQASTLKTTDDTDQNRTLRFFEQDTNAANQLAEYIQQNPDISGTSLLNFIRGLPKEILEQHPYLLNASPDTLRQVSTNLLKNMRPDSHVIAEQNLKSYRESVDDMINREIGQRIDRSITDSNNPELTSFINSVFGFSSSSTNGKQPTLTPQAITNVKTKITDLLRKNNLDITNPVNQRLAAYAISMSMDLDKDKGLLGSIESTYGDVTRGSTTSTNASNAIDNDRLQRNFESIFQKYGKQRSIDANYYGANGFYNKDTLDRFTRHALQIAQREKKAINDPEIIKKAVNSFLSDRFLGSPLSDEERNHVRTVYTSLLSGQEISSYTPFSLSSTDANPKFAAGNEISILPGLSDQISAIDNQIGQIRSRLTSKDISDSNKDLLQSRLIELNQRKSQLSSNKKSVESSMVTSLANDISVFERDLNVFVNGDWKDNNNKLFSYLEDGYNRSSHSGKKARQKAILAKVNSIGQQITNNEKTIHNYNHRTRQYTEYDSDLDRSVDRYVEEEIPEREISSHIKARIKELQNENTRLRDIAKKLRNIYN